MNLQELVQNLTRYVSANSFPRHGSQIKNLPIVYRDSSGKDQDINFYTIEVDRVVLEKI
jgi:hypothetical protein